VSRRRSRDPSAATSPDSWSRRARRAAGPVVVASRRWNAHGRVLPDFVILGAQKSGTTTLYGQLARHPAVMPALRKEVHFFDAPPRPIEWYRAFFPRRRALEARRQAVGHAVTGEATPFYLMHPLASVRLRAALPRARLVAILRDPVERAVSGYHHAVRMGHETRAIEVALDPENEETRPYVEEGYDDPACPTRLRGYLARGHYAEQLTRWFAQVGRERVLVLETRELAGGAALAKTLDFLGLPATGLESGSDRNVGRYEPPAPEVEQRLRDYFKDHNETLFTLLGCRFDWPT
jgi:hypothetical protein